MRPLVTFNFSPCKFLGLIFFLFTTTFSVAQVTITQATGGTTLSADKAANATAPGFTVLTNIVIQEGNKSDIGFVTNKTFTIATPTGWSFNPGVGTVSAPFSPTGDLTAISISVTTGSVVVTYSTNNNNRFDTITVSGLQVRANDGANVPGTGNLVFSSLSASIAGITAGTTTAGSLSQVIGSIKYLTVTLPGQTFTDGLTLAGSGNSGTVTAQKVGTSFVLSGIRATDQFFNVVTSYSGTKTIAYSGPGTSSGGSPTYTTSVSFTSGVATTTLTTTLRKAETVSITAKEGSLYGLASSSLVVSAKTLTLSSPNVTSKVYDGTTSATINGTLNGILGNDVVSLNGTGNFNNKNVGSAKPVTATCTLTGADANNYTLTQPTGLTGAVTAKAMIVTAQDVSKYFNTNYVLGNSAFTSSGLISGETIGQVTLTSSGAPANAAIGTYSIIPSAATGGTFTASNYAITYVNGTLTVETISVGGTVNGGTTICSGTATNLSLSGQTGNVIRWEYAVSPYTSWSAVANTSTTYSTGPLTQTTRFRAVVQYGGSPTANASEAEIIVGGSTTWNGNTWSNGNPSAFKSAIISGAYTSVATEDIAACSLTVNNNATVNFTSGHSVTLSGPITVATGSTVMFENNANLIQTGSGYANSGNVIIKRESAPLKRLDYTLWSSPVAAQALQAFSPQTVSNRFYTYNANSNLYDLIVAPSTTNFENAKGYLIRTPNNHPVAQAESWTGVFTGVPNNGDYSFSLVNGGEGKRFNLIGNPYPSPLDLEAFISNSNNAVTITGTLYFWRKTNNSQNPSYCTFTPLGGFVSNGNATANAFSQSGTTAIQPGQGFFVEATGAGSGTVKFDNTMRVNNHGNHFLRSSNGIEKHRIWLNATSNTGGFSQMMVGYFANATQEADANIDGKYMNDGDIALSSLIDSTPYTIQGRALPFDASDVVPLQFKVATAGNYTIAIDHADGIFAGSQTVYLRDNLIGLVHELNASGYEFTSDAGTFANRFELIYQQSLGTSTPNFSSSQVVIYRDLANNLIINTGVETMVTAKIFDIKGSLLASQNNINSNQTAFNININNEVVLVQVTSDKGVIVTKKYMMQRMTLKKDKETMVKVQLAEDE